MPSLERDRLLEVIGSLRSIVWMDSEAISDAGSAVVAAIGDLQTTVWGDRFLADEPVISIDEYLLLQDAVDALRESFALAMMNGNRQVCRLATQTLDRHLCVQVSVQWSERFDAFVTPGASTGRPVDHRSNTPLRSGSTP